MLNILVCDDSKDDLDTLTEYLKCRYGDIGVQIIALLNPREVLTYIRNSSLNVDIAILDVIMPCLNGTELAVQMRDSGFDGSIIFLTTSRSFGVEAYEVEASGYLLKPVNTEKLSAVLDKIELQKKREDNASIVIISNRKHYRILLSNIIYVEARSHIIYVHTLDGQEMPVRSTLKHYAPLLLADKRFAACHSAYIVNMQHVKSLGSNELLLCSGQSLRISRNYNDFCRTYIKQLMKEE